MQYLVLFLEGIITFISPCLLPMLPIYVSYFAANESQTTTGGKSKALTNSIGFVVGFTLVFIALGAFAGTVGKLLHEYATIFNIVTGLIVVVFGLNFLGVLKIGFLNFTHKRNANTKDLGFFSSMLFGMVFSIGWTPCVGAFLGSALILASQQGSAAEGVFMLLIFSLGLGIPFVISAVLIDKLKGTFDFIKRNYTVINAISGGLLVIIGILMMTGYMGYFLSLLTF
jgi:cytochrome c-type biogenesis protein